MAWNKSLQRKVKKTSPVLKVLLYSIFLIGMCAIWLMFHFKEPEYESEFVGAQKESKQTMSKAPTIKPKSPKSLSRLEAGIYIDERGIKRYPGGLRVSDKNENIAPRLDFNKLNPPRFKNIVDEQIATLIELEPGAGVFGTLPYGDAFDKRFLESLKEDVSLIDLEGTRVRSEYDIELQKCVQDTKKEILERYKNGEKPSSIMSEARAELQRLGQYTHQLRQQVFEIMRDERYSDDDIQDFKTAANELLKQQGLPELRFPSMVFRQHLINNKRMPKE